MKREIKFRAWSEENKEIYYKDFEDFVMPEDKALFNTGLDNNGNLFAFSNNGKNEDEKLVLMQFTGLKDKNGKEIYEGDIISHNDKKIVIVNLDKWGINGIVINKNLGNVLNDAILMTSHHRYEFNTIYCIRKYIEVIGNIYETPLPH